MNYRGDQQAGLGCEGGPGHEEILGVVLNFFVVFFGSSPLEFCLLGDSVGVLEITGILALPVPREAVRF